MFQHILDNIDALSQNDLESTLRNEIPILGVFALDISPGLYITRCRQGFQYPNISDFSYNPKPANEFGRLNYPNQSVFYGTIADSDIISSRYVSALECSSLLSDGDCCGEEFLSYGLWQNIQQLNCAVILGVNSEYNSALYSDLSEKFSDSLKAVNQEERKLHIDLNNCLADIFSKPSSENIYRFTSAYANILFKSGYDAIIYFSVKTNGQYGLNIAVKPVVVDSKMQLLKTESCKLMRNGKEAVIKTISHGAICDKSITYQNI